MSFLSAILLLGATPVGAEEADARARQLYEEGRTHFDAGQYDQCILLWREAFGLSNRAGLLFNLAEAEERAERFAEAAESLESYVASGERHAQTNRVSINRRIARLRRQAASSPAPPPLVPQPEEPEPQPEPVPRPDPQPEPQPRPQPEQRPRIWTWVAAGLTGLFTVGAVVTGVLTLTMTSDLEEVCGGTACTGEHQADWDTAWALAITTDVLIGLASASAVATILLIFLENRSQRQATASVAPWMGPGQAGLVTSFSF